MDVNQTLIMWLWLFNIIAILDLTCLESLEIISRITLELNNFEKVMDIDQSILSDFDNIIC